MNRIANLTCCFSLMLSGLGTVMAQKQPVPGLPDLEVNLTAEPEQPPAPTQSEAAPPAGTIGKAIPLPAIHAGKAHAFAYRRFSVLYGRIMRITYTRATEDLENFVKLEQELVDIKDGPGHTDTWLVKDAIFERTPVPKETAHRKRQRAVILDLDETVLDNSPFQERLAMAGKDYDSDLWREWCLEGKAACLPGARNFIENARELGCKVLFVSNRRNEVEAATVGNLTRVLGYPVSGCDVYLKDDKPDLPEEVAEAEAKSGLDLSESDAPYLWVDKDDLSRKSLRRIKIGEDYFVEMIFGDVPGDFMTFDNLPKNLTQEQESLEKAKQFEDSFQSRWVPIFNGFYGDWEAFKISNE